MYVILSVWTRRFWCEFPRGDEGRVTGMWASDRHYVRRFPTEARAEAYARSHGIDDYAVVSAPTP